LGRGGPRTKTDALFMELKEHITETVHRHRRWETWTTQRTWTRIDKRAVLRRGHDIESRVQSRRFARWITKLIRRNQQKREMKFGVAIKAMLAGHSLQGARRALQAWYTYINGRSSKASRQDLSKLEVQFKELYQLTPSQQSQYLY
jgi:hypothetical protein